MQRSGIDTIKYQLNLCYPAKLIINGITRKGETGHVSKLDESSDANGAVSDSCDMAPFSYEFLSCKISLSQPPIYLLHRIKSILNYEEEGPVSYE